MRQVTASGQTVEEAVQSACVQLDVTRDKVEIEVIDEGRKGFLGFGSKPAVIKAITLKDPIEETKEYIAAIGRQMNVNADVTAAVNGKHVTFELSGEKIALLIGKRGQTLNALQYIAQLAINKDGGRYYAVTVDAEGYRGRRKETLVSLASKMAEKAKRIEKKVALEPMPAFERKIIHSALQAREDVSTYSDGRDPHRHIVIKPS